MALTVKEKWALIVTVLDSVEEPHKNTLSPEDQEAAWKVEIEKSLDSIDNGTASLLTQGEIDRGLDEIEARFRAKEKC